MKSNRNLIMAILATVVLGNACKKNSIPAPSKNAECLINSFSTGNQSASSYTGNITYNADKTISEVKIVQTGNATIDDKYSYTGNTTTILSNIVYNNGSSQPTTSIITKNSSGQVTGLRFATGDGREGDVYAFTYAGQNISTATVTRFIDNTTSPAGTVNYNYDSKGNLLSLFDVASGQKLISFTYDDTMPAKPGDLFGYYQLSYGENVQLFAFLYPIHNNNLCSGSPGFAPATFTYDNNKNISTMSFGNAVYNYGYDCGN
jgi:hypothetical protein